MGTQKTKKQRARKMQIVICEWCLISQNRWTRTYQGSNFIAAEVVLQGSRFTGGKQWHWKAWELGSLIHTGQGKDGDMNLAKKAADACLSTIFSLESGSTP